MWPGGLCIQDGEQAICVQLSVKNRLLPLAVQETQMCMKHFDCSSQGKSANGQTVNRAVPLIKRGDTFFIHTFFGSSAYLLFQLFIMKEDWQRLSLALA